MSIIKFAIPLAAMICFGALSLSAKETSSKKSSTASKSRSTSDSGTSKKNSTSKKSAKARKSTKSTKAKSRQTGGKGKGKNHRSSAEATAAQDWVDRLPSEELPELDETPEDELLDPAAESEP